MATVAVNRDIKVSLPSLTTFPQGSPIQEWGSEGVPVILVPGQPELLLSHFSFSVTQQLWCLTERLIGGVSIALTLHLRKNKLRTWLSKSMICKLLTLKIISNPYHLWLFTSRFRAHTCCFLFRRPRLTYSLKCDPVKSLEKSRLLYLKVT